MKGEVGPGGIGGGGGGGGGGVGCCCFSGKAEKSLSPFFSSLFAFQCQYFQYSRAPACTHIVSNTQADRGLKLR